nr:MetaGeneMark_Unknown Function [uncultured bacterium]
MFYKVIFNRPGLYVNVAGDEVQQRCFSRAIRSPDNAMIRAINHKVEILKEGKI